jgi:hypothetical protein
MRRENVERGWSDVLLLREDDAVRGWSDVLLLLCGEKMK